MAPVTQQHKKNKPAVGQKAAAKPALVYVGPNLAGDLRLAQFTVFRGGLPKEVQAVVEADAVMGRLFVPVADLAQARADMSKASSVLQQAAGHAFKKYRLGRVK